MQQTTLSVMIYLQTPLRIRSAESLQSIILMLGASGGMRLALPLTTPAVGVGVFSENFSRLFIHLPPSGGAFFFGFKPFFFPFKGAGRVRRSREGVPEKRWFGRNFPAAGRENEEEK